MRLAYVLLASIFVASVMVGSAPAGTLELWLRADAGVEEAAGDPAEDGDAVINWLNQSTGAGGDASQPTEANRPTLKTNILNGKPVIRFDSSGENYMDDTFSSSVAQQYTIFLVGKMIGSSPTGAADYFFDGMSSSSRVAMGLNPSGGNQNEFFIYAGGAGLLDIPWSVSQRQEYHVYEALYGGSDSGLFIDGTIMASDPLGSNPISGLRIGTRYNKVPWTAFLNGDIAEMLVYSGQMDDTERNEAGAYLGNKYGLATAYPEPTSMLLLGLGTAGLIMLVRRRK